MLRSDWSRGRKGPHQWEAGFFDRVKDTYIDEDEDENIQFMDQYLEQIVKEEEVESKDDLKKS